MEKLQEAAEEYFMKYTDIISMAGTKEKVVRAMVGFATIQQQQSKEVIEELVKALEESKEELNRCLPFVQNTRQFYAVHGKIIMIDELIQKHRNNEKQG